MKACIKRSNARRAWNYFYDTINYGKQCWVRYGTGKDECNHEKIQCEVRIVSAILWCSFMYTPMSTWMKQHGYHHMRRTRHIGGSNAGLQLAWLQQRLLWQFNWNMITFTGIWVTMAIGWWLKDYFKWQFMAISLGGEAYSFEISFAGMVLDSIQWLSWPCLTIISRGLPIWLCTIYGWLQIDDVDVSTAWIRRFGLIFDE